MAEQITDHDFYVAHVQWLSLAAPRGACVSIIPSATCQICTRPLYGQTHEEWHVARHVKQLGLTL